MAKDYQNLLDYAASLQQSAQPQQQMPLDSELPGPQLAPGPQTGGGAQGLLDVLGSIGSGIGTGLLGVLQAIPEVAAYRQAALGQPEALKAIQEERKQTKLAGSLTDYLNKPEFSQFAPEISAVVQSGDKRQMAKLAIELPRRKKFQESINAAPITSEQKDFVRSLASYDLESADKTLREMTRVTGLESSKERLQTLKQQSKVESDLAKLKQKEAALPENVVLAAIESGQLDPNDPKLDERIAGLLEGRKIAVKKDTVKNIIANPKIQRLVPDQNILTQLFNKLGIRSKPVAMAAPAAAPAQPKMPAVGEVRNGFRFKGGNPADKNNWEKQ